MHQGVIVSTFDS